MKRKILLIVVVSFMIMGVVSAASLWGNYKGNQIIRLTVDGVPVKVSDAPAVSMDGRTMIPIYLLQQAGIQYTWDQKKQTVNISPQIQEVSSEFKISDISRDMKKLNIEFVEYVSDGKGFNSITFHYDFSFDILFNENNGVNLDTIFQTGLKTDATLIKVIDKDGNSMAVTDNSLRDFYDGKLTGEQFISEAKLEGNYFTNNNSTSSVVTPIPSSYPELYSNDGKTFLGKLTTNKYDSDSVFNEYGTYGNKYQSKSIWNEYGDYGSNYSNTSAFNKYATKPPIIILDSKVIGYLTVNTTLANGISPNGLLSWLDSNGY